MALNAEVLKANEVLATLSDDQMTAIATLSANDEAVVISSKIGELHGRYDLDVKEVTGIEKAQGEKSYDYVKRVLGDFKSKVGGSAELQTKITGYEQKISTLEKAISEGKGNEAMVQKLRDTESQLAQLNTQYSTDKQVWEREKGEFSSQITAIQVDTQFEKAIAGLKFKAGYPEEIQNTLLQSTKNSILGQYKADWVEADGKKVMVFRDSKGEIARNQSNGLNPFTAQELIKNSLKGVLDEGRAQEGGGTKSPGGNGGAIEIVSISGAKTQLEADELIVKYLLQKGELRGSASFGENQAKLRKDNGVDKLPIR